MHIRAQHGLTALILFLFTFATPCLSTADDQAPILLTADQVIVDQDQSRVRAVGSVEVVQHGYVLRADQLIFHQDDNRIIADGNISLLEPDGNILFAERAELTNQLRDGVAHRIGMLLSDNSKLAADAARRINGRYVILDRASYTPCSVCPENPIPTWAARADQIVHDKKNNQIKYKNLRLEVLGTPIGVIPYWAHADPTVERKTGFLRPDFGVKSRLGAFLRNYYYIDMAPNRDATVEVTATSKQGPLIGLNLRQRFDHARLDISGSFTQSDRTKVLSNSRQIFEEDKTRGHVFIDGRMDINDHWRGGIKVARTTDNQYLDTYDYNAPDILTNTVYAERFKGRSHTRIEGFYFQDTRPLFGNDQPNIFPRIQHRAFMAPNSALGGRFGITADTFGLIRDGGIDENDTARISITPEFERRDFWGGGLVTTARVDLQSDAYLVERTNDSDITTRVVPRIYLRGEYPLFRPLSGGNITITPMMATTIAPDDDNDPDIPNEDSRDVPLDFSNLFDASRFPGRDRIEYGQHIAYGLTGQITAHNGNRLAAGLGQSYDISDDEDVFPAGSGLENQASDIIGFIRGDVANLLTLNYRFQLGSEDLASRQHEFRAGVTLGGLSINGEYLFTDRIGGTGILTERQELRQSASYRINDRWVAGGSFLHDLTGRDGLLKASASLIYQDECFTLSARAVRDLTNELSGESENSLILSVGFKNLGQFQSPDIDLNLLGGQDDE
jgi:LPS-assembly protein